MFFSLLLVLCAAIQDAKTWMVSDLWPAVLAIVFVVFVLLYSALVGDVQWMQLFLRLVSSTCVFLMLLALTVFLERKFHMEMFGGGDIKIIAASSLFMGIEPLLIALIVAFSLFLGFHSIIAAKNKEQAQDAAYPFVPFYAIGYAAVSLALMIL